MTVLDRAFVKAFHSRPHFHSEPSVARSEDGTVSIPIASELVSIQRAEPSVPACSHWNWPVKSRSVLNATREGFERLGAQLVDVVRSRRMKSIGFVSPGRGHGRTTTLLALTQVLVEVESQRVLLVDADFGHPEIALQLGIVPPAGLWEVANGHAPLNAAVLELIPSRFDFLAECGSGQVGLWNSERHPDALAVLEKCRRRCELLLIDAGPLRPLNWIAEWDRDVMDAVVCVASSHLDRDQLTDAELTSRFELVDIEYLGRIETSV